MTTNLPAESVLDSLGRLRSLLGEVRLPLEVRGVARARQDWREIVGQLDDYVLPRLCQLDAPLLTVVGGSTGAGKSTLVNSVVGAEVSRPGVLRPTTRAPVLVYHPDDEHWFAGQRILAGLARTTGGASEPGTLRLVPSDALRPGLALLDAPDIDSVVRENQELAAQLLAAGDLWLFVTTAARYADAVPWELLRIARERGTALAVVLDRVPDEAVADVRDHLAVMLAEHGLDDAPLFVVPESELADGRLPEPAVAPVRTWLRRLAEDAQARAAVVRRTLDGALDSLGPRVAALADAVAAQGDAAEALRGGVADAYRAAAQGVDAAVSDGSLLRGEVLARWQEFVGTGELMRSLEARIGRLRDRVTALFLGRPQPGTELRVALGHGLEALVRAHADRAAERAAQMWRAHPAGEALFRGADLAQASRDLPDRVAEMVRGWQGYVLDLIREQGTGKRATARFLSLGVNGLGLLLMIGVFGHTGGLTGVEVGVASGTSVLSQKLLEAVFGDQAVRQLTTAARRELGRRVEALLAEEAARYTRLLDAADVRPEQAGQLRAAVAALYRARAEEERKAGRMKAASP